MQGKAFGAVIVVLGLLIILTPWYIFPVCGKGRHAPPPGTPIGVHGCHKTLKAETVLGLVTIGVGFVPIVWPRKKAALGAAAATMVLAVLVILFPTAITGMCKVKTMPCLTGTLPALWILTFIMAVAGAGGLLVARKLP